MNMMTQTSPYLHDRWEDEVALEQEMLVLGRSRMEAKINRLKQKGDMTSLRPHRNLIQEWIDPVGKEIGRWVEANSKSRGPKPISLEFLRDMDHFSTAVVALKTILRRMGDGRAHIIPLAFEIGTWCEHEARAAAWIEDDPQGWKAMTTHYERRGSDPAHMRRSRVSIFNKYISEKIGWEDWTDEERRRVGLSLIDCVVQATKRFSITPDPSYRPKIGVKNRTAPIVLMADNELITWIKNSVDDEVLHAYAYLPTIIPPKPWEGPRDGGYWTPFVKAPFMIRFKAMHEDQRQRAIDEFDAIDMPWVYSALNKLQNTPWKINQRVLDVAQKVWDLDLAIAGFPRREEETVPKRPPEAELDENILRQWKRDAGEVRTRNATRISHYISHDRVLRLAERFSKEPCFYFPHMMDFRGRMYPIPSELSPQGGDIHRGLLTFAKGKKVSKTDARWLAIQVANTHGVDKLSMDERIDWTFEHNDLWFRIAEDPMSNKEWAEADDPWQALAAIFEWTGYLKDPENFVSSLPIRVDGTCNGIQHLSAMVRDEVGAKAVNVLPGDKPNDIYQDVADHLRDNLLQINRDMEGYQEAIRWLDILGPKFKRSLTKRQVMILPYGGTPSSYLTYTMDWVKETLPKETFTDDEDRFKMTLWLSSRIWEAVSNSIDRPKEVMKWLKDVASIAVKSGNPIHWITPSGFVVRQFYGKVTSTEVTTKIDGQRYVLRADQLEKEADSKAQLTAIAPNFVHSMDASALMECLNICEVNDIPCVTTIHDSFGTVAADLDKMDACIREAFIATHEAPVLENFLRSCQQANPDQKDWPKVPHMGQLDLTKCRESQYFFS